MSNFKKYYVIFFSFYVYVLHLMTWNIIVFENVSNQPVHSPHLYLLTHPCQQLKLKRTTKERLKLKHLNKMFRMFLFFGILKRCGYLFMQEFVIC